LKAKKKKASLLTTYNVWHTVSFATGIQSNSSTAIDHVCVNNSRLSLSCLFPIINGLSDHSAQIITKIYMQQYTNFLTVSPHTVGCPPSDA